MYGLELSWGHLKNNQELNGAFVCQPRSYCASPAWIANFLTTQMITSQSSLSVHVIGKSIAVTETLTTSGMIWLKYKSKKQAQKSLKCQWEEYQG